MSTEYNEKFHKIHIITSNENVLR